MHESEEASTSSGQQWSRFVVLREDIVFRIVPDFSRNIRSSICSLDKELEKELVTHVQLLFVRCWSIFQDGSSSVFLDFFHRKGPKVICLSPCISWARRPFGDKMPHWEAAGSLAELFKCSDLVTLELLIRFTSYFLFIYHWFWMHWSPSPFCGDSLRAISLVIQDPTFQLRMQLHRQQKGRISASKSHLCHTLLIMWSLHAVNRSNVYHKATRYNSQHNGGGHIGS